MNMKKIAGILAVLAVLAVVCVGAGAGAKVTITYDANGGDGPMQNVVVENENEAKANVGICGFSLNNSDFVEWNTAWDGSGVTYEVGGGITAKNEENIDIKLYAIWADNVWSLHANSGEGHYVIDETGKTVKIYSAEGLAHFSNEVNNERKSFDGYTVTLENDIDLKDYEWVPIGRYNVEYWIPIDPKIKNYSFDGVFDGNGKTISNLTIERKGLSGLGLFGWLRGGSNVEIKNVNLKNVKINGKDCLGSIAGSINYEVSPKVTNCSVSGKVNVEGSGADVGGLIGLVNHQGTNEIKVSQCSVNGDVTSYVKGMEVVGGIVGGSSNETSLNIEECVSNIDVAGRKKVGGIVGQLYMKGEYVPKISGAKSYGNIVVVEPTADECGYYGTIVGCIVHNNNVKSGNISNSASYGCIIGWDEIKNLKIENQVGIVGAYYKRFDWEDKVDDKGVNQLREWVGSECYYNVTNSDESGLLVPGEGDKSGEMFAGGNFVNIQEPVAQIKDDEIILKYATLQDAVDAAQSGDTITLLKDVEEGAYDFLKFNGVDEAAEYIIDFGGHTWTVNSDDPVGSNKNQALRIRANNNESMDSPDKLKVVLKNGTIKIAENKVKYATVINSYVDLVLDNFTVDGSNIVREAANKNSYSVVVETGKLTVTNGSKILCPEEKNNIAKAYAIYSYNGAGNYKVSPSIVIENGDVEGRVIFEKKDGAGYGWSDGQTMFEINGGKFRGEISIGEWAGDKKADIKLNDGDIEVLIPDGISFEAVLSGVSVGSIEIEDDIVVDSNMIIPEKVTVVVPANKKLVCNNGKLTVVGTINAEAKVANTDGTGSVTYYGSLKDAVTAAMDKQTVTLLKDVTLKEGVDLMETGTYIIDGKGHSIIDGGVVDGDHVFCFGAGGANNGNNVGTKNYTLKDVVIEGFDGSWNNGVVRAEGCTITINGCKFVENKNSAGSDLCQILRMEWCVPTIINTDFNGNYAKNIIDIDCEADGNTIKAIISNSKFIGNSFETSLIFANGITWDNVVVDPSSCEITNCLFERNEGKTGAAGVVLSSKGVVEIKNSTFRNNEIGGDNRGGVSMLYMCGRADVEGNLFENNSIATKSDLCDRASSVVTIERKESVVKNNAMVCNHVTGNNLVGGDVSVLLKGVSADLDGNYWGTGKQPLVGVGADIYADGSVAITSYGYSYVLNSEDYGVTVLTTKVVTTTDVTIAAGFGGAVNSEKVENVTIGSDVTVSENKITIGDNNVTASPKSGYVFDSWNVKDGSKVVKDMTITANFRPVETTTLFYNGNGGTTEGITDDVGTAGRTVTVTDVSPVRDGYTFDGYWYESPDKIGAYYAAGASISSLDSNKTLYAGWIAATFSVIFNGNYSGAKTYTQTGFTAGVPKQLTSFESMGITEKRDCTFDGWATTATGPVQYRDGQTVTLTSSSDVTLYAVWQANAEQKYDISGSITGPAGDVFLKVMLGNVQIGEVKKVTLPASGGFTFSNIPNGVYNLVATKEEKIVTKLIEVKNGSVGGVAIEIPTTNSANSVVEVKEENATPNVVIGKLDEEAQEMTASGSVTVVMTVKSEVKADVPDTPEYQEEKKVQDAVVSIDEKAQVDLAEPTVTFVNITVTKYVQGSSEEKITNTSKVIEIVIPYDLSSANSVMVYKNHDGSTTQLTQDETGEAGTFKVDKRANKVYIYTNEFSVYAIATSTESMPEPTPEQPTQSSTVTVFHGTAATYDGTILFDRSTVVTSAELPGATSAKVTPISTKDGGWYTFKLDADGFAGNGTVWFQVPLDVIAVKDMTETDVSLFDCDTVYLSKDGRYAYYKASVAAAGTYTIGFEAGAARAEIVDEPTPIAPVVEPIAPVTPQPTATPAPVLGLLAGLGAAAVLLKRRQ